MTEISTTTHFKVASMLSHTQMVFIFDPYTIRYLWNVLDERTAFMENNYIHLNLSYRTLRFIP